MWERGATAIETSAAHTAFALGERGLRDGCGCVMAASNASHFPSLAARQTSMAANRAQLSLMLVLTVSTYRIAIGDTPPFNYQMVA